MAKYIPYERRPLAIAGRDCLRICNEVSARMQPMYKFQLGTSICNIAAKQAVCIYNALNEPMESKNKLSLIDKIPELTNSLQEQFAIDGTTAKRRMNDALAGMFGDGGGGDLWKIWFNKNARAGLY